MATVVHTDDLACEVSCFCDVISDGTGLTEK